MLRSAFETLEECYQVAGVDMGVTQSEVNLPTGVDELVEKIVSSRRITKADQMRMMSALLSQHSISEREHRQINRVFEALRSGLIRVVD